ncbi:MAG: nucleoside deaminase, partial [Brachybacterium sp.]|nr:nucleoside deaminase [Brachybacterium sp.]
EEGGLPFVGAVLDPSGRPLSGHGVNRVAETGDPTAHAEIVALREVISSHGPHALVGARLLATGEPCGLCYRFALDHGIGEVIVAVDRDAVAAFGIDYRSSYAALDVTDKDRDRVLRLLEVPRAEDPFTRFTHPSPAKGRTS